MQRFEPLMTEKHHYHRTPSSTIGPDEILVLDEGAVVERGHHDDLIARRAVS